MEMILISKDELVNLIRDEFNSRPQFSPDKKEPDLCGVQEIAALTGWAVQTIYSKHSAGEFPKNCVFKRGKKIFFSKTEIIAWIKSGKLK